MSILLAPIHRGSREREYLTRETMCCMPGAGPDFTGGGGGNGGFSEVAEAPIMAAVVMEV